MATRPFYARQPRGTLVLGVLIWVLTTRSAWEFTRGDGNLIELLSLLFLSAIVALMVRNRWRPVVEISETELVYGPLLSLSRRTLALSRLEGVEEDSSLFGRLRKAVRLRWSGGRVDTIHLMDLDEKSRGEVLTALREIARA
jgi:hypothetical protein